MEKLMNLIDHCGSPFHVIEMCEKQLLSEGFEKLDLKQSWLPQLGQSYYVTPSPSVLIAFVLGEDAWQGANFRIGLAHTDQPALKIKPSPGMMTGNYKKVNVEKYGGMINNTWLDRPLSAAGKVILKGEDPFSPKVRLLDLKDPVFIIPNLAIHMNPQINKGEELNNQVDMIPLTALGDKDHTQEKFFVPYIAGKLSVSPDEILDYDLYLYNTDKAACIGMEKEFLSAPRIDNLASVQALVDGITNGKRNDGINVIALFDNEEVGSRSKQGADSLLLHMVLEKLFDARGYSRGEFISAVSNSFMISVDGAHAMHPNHPEKHDPTNPVFLGSGIVMKTSATQRYVTDSEASAVMTTLCKQHEILYQKQVNRSDMPGGQTLGPIASSYLPMLAADLGIPMLAMHSARELAAVKDYEELVKLMTVFFK